MVWLSTTVTMEMQTWAGFTTLGLPDLYTKDRGRLKRLLGVNYQAGSEVRFVAGTGRGRELTQASNTAVKRFPESVRVARD